MKPEIKINDNFIEVIGHYDDKTLCAKLTLLADLYAVEHKDGYAKFDIKDKDKLNFIDDKLEFVDESYFYIDNQKVFHTDMDDQTCTVGSNGFTFSASYIYSGTYTNYTYSGSVFTYTGSGIFQGLTINGTLYSDGDVISIPAYSTIIYATTTTLTLPSIDLTTLENYSSLASGTYTIHSKSKASGYADSDFSTGVSFTKS